MRLGKRRRTLARTVSFWLDSVEVLLSREYRGSLHLLPLLPPSSTSQLSDPLEPRHHQISVAADLWLSRLAQFTCRVGGRNKNFHGACRLALLPASALPLLRPLLSRSCPQYSIEQGGERRRCRPPSSSEDGVLLFSVPSRRARRARLHAWAPGPLGSARAPVAASLSRLSSRLTAPCRACSRFGRRSPGRPLTESTKPTLRGRQTRRSIRDRTELH